MKQKKYTLGILGMALLFSVVLMSCGSAETSNQGSAAQTSTSSIESAIEAGAFLVDVRTPGEFAGGNVPGSINIPLGTVEANLEQFKNKKSIVVFCASGGRSSRAKSLLENAGITDVYNGGAWTAVLKIVNQQASQNK